MTARMLYRLPTSDVGVGNIEITTDGVELTIRYEYWEDGRDIVGVVQFEVVLAFRFHDEAHSFAFPSCKESYNAIAEVTESDWLKQLIAMEVGLPLSAKGKHHYAMFLTNNGLLEVIAARYTILNSYEGQLE
jgi:hypothetical protein